MVRKKGKERDRDRLKIDMQFQVHTADDDKMLRCGKRYGGKDAPRSSIPANRKITFKDKKIAETSSLPMHRPIYGAAIHIHILHI